MSMDTPAGALYLVATPIGNLEDITRRALRVLGEVDLVVAEDTRRTRKLLAHYELDTPLLSLHEHNERARVPALVRRLAAGEKMALVSDAGSPLISDPGFVLVRESIDADIRVVPVPGPSAVISALISSGLPTDRYLFVGYLPRKAAARRRALEELREEPGTLVVLESPRRLVRMLTDAAEVLGSRPAAVARELTKVHEELVRGSLDVLIEQLAQRAVRGEVTVCIGGYTRNRQAAKRNHEGLASRADLVEHYERLVGAGRERNDALRAVARAHGISRREVYDAVVVGRRRSPGAQDS